MWTEPVSRGQTGKKKEERESMMWSKHVEILFQTSKVVKKEGREGGGRKKVNLTTVRVQHLSFPYDWKTNTSSLNTIAGRATRTLCEHEPNCYGIVHKKEKN